MGEVLGEVAAARVGLGRQLVGSGGGGVVGRGVLFSLLLLFVFLLLMLLFKDGVR